MDEAGALGKAEAGNNAVCVLMFTVFVNSTENEEYTLNSVGVLNCDSSNTEEIS